MKKITLLSLVCLITINSFTQSINLFSETNRISKKSFIKEKDPSILNSYEVKLNIDSLTNNNYSFNIGAKHFELSKGNFRQNDFGYEVWTSDLKESRYYQSMLINRNRKVSGYIVTNDRLYRIHPSDNDFMLITEQNHNIPENECDTPVDTLPEEINKLKSSTATTSSTCSTNEIYRMIISYTPQFSATFSNQQDLNNFLIQVIESVNETYINSNINVRARLVYAYETSDSETGNKDTDFDRYFHRAGDTPKFPDKWIEFDEIWDLRSEYNADVCILLVSANIGGRAGSSRRVAVYGKNGADWNYGVAHEVGHMFDLEHNREEFDDCCALCFVCKATLDDYDEKKAYGFRGTYFKTVMSYGSQWRHSLYSDEGYSFPDGQIAGNDKAHAKIYLENHVGNVLKYSEKTDITLSDVTVESDEIVNHYALNSIEANNFIIKSNSNVIFQSGNQITLEPGFSAEVGAAFQAKIVDCDNSFGFKSSKIESESEKSIKTEVLKVSNEFKIYPNPTSDLINIEVSDNLNIDRVVIAGSNGEIILNNYFRHKSSIISLDLGNQKTGLYVIQITADNKIFQHKLIIK